MTVFMEKISKLVCLGVGVCVVLSLALSVAHFWGPSSNLHTYCFVSFLLANMGHKATQVVFLR